MLLNPLKCFVENSIIRYSQSIRGFLLLLWGLLGIHSVFVNRYCYCGDYYYYF